MIFINLVKNYSNGLSEGEYNCTNPQVFNLSFIHHKNMCNRPLKNIPISIILDKN